MLLQSFAICPAPGFWQLKKLLPIAWSIYLLLSKIALFSAPTIKVKVPACAPVTPPETGASTYVIPFDLAC